MVMLKHRRLDLACLSVCFVLVVVCDLSVQCSVYYQKTEEMLFQLCKAKNSTNGKIVESQNHLC